MCLKTGSSIRPQSRQISPQSHRHGVSLPRSHLPTVTANSKARSGFFTLDDDFIRVPFNDVSTIEVLTDDVDICAVFVEPIQGEGGLHTPSDDYLEKLQNICHANDWLFMLDEVQTGNGRTGKYFAYQYSNVKPDVPTTAKGLAVGWSVLSMIN